MSPADRATFVPFVADWTQRSLVCRPLSDRGRAAPVEELHRAYRTAGLPWPGRVWWVASPVVGDLAARTAAVTVHRDHELRIASAAPRARRMAVAVRRGTGRLLGAAWMVGVVIVGYSSCWAAGAMLAAVCVERGQRTGFVVFCAGLGALLGAASGWNDLGRYRKAHADAAAGALLDTAVAEIDATGRRVLAALLDTGSAHPGAVEEPLTSGVRRPVDEACGRVWTAIDEIHRHHNSEVRRAAIERLGWLTYIEQAGLHLVASAPDPGNPPHQLRLYADPQRRLGPARVLMMTHGRPSGTGQPLRYAETVPDHIDDPVEAAAWQYGCPVDIYRTLQRRT